MGLEEFMKSFDQRWGNEMQDWKVSYCCCYGGVVDVVCLSEGGRGAWLSWTEEVDFRTKNCDVIVQDPQISTILLLSQEWELEK